MKALIKNLGYFYVFVAAGAVAVLWILIIVVSVTNIKQHYDYNSYTTKVMKNNDDVTNIVYQTCDTHKLRRDKIDCVVNFYKDIEYIKHHDDKIKNPTDFYYEGGVCRDFAIAVCATLLKMDNIDCSYDFLPNHVFPVVRYGNKYCICDRECVCNA